MKTIAVINQKGGVGKTTTSHLLGDGIARKGFRVLYVDLDPQCNLSITFGRDPRHSEIFDILKNPELNPIEWGIEETPLGDIVTGSDCLSLTERFFKRDNSDGMEIAHRLETALKAVKSRYDFCIIDTPPSLGVLTINALTACNGVLIPAQADLYSVQGIAQLKKTVKTVKDFCNRSLTVLGIVLTRFNKRAVIRRGMADTLEKMAKAMGTRLFSTRIRECVAIVEAEANGKSVFEYAPKSNASKDYFSLVEEVLQII